MFKVHKTHDEWLVMSGNRTICRCDFKDDAENIAELESDRRRLEFLRRTMLFFPRKLDWRDVIDEAMESEQ